MRQWLSKNKWKVIVPAAVLAVLTLAWLVGGKTPSSGSQSAAAAVSAEVSASASPEASAQETLSAPVSASPAASAAAGESSGDPNTEKADEKHCTVSISCATILSNMDKLSEEKRSLVPSDGCILQETTVTFSEGESVFDVLQRVTRQKGIQMEFENVPVYSSAYIEGIANIYEFDVGELSGWEYSVNGVFPGYGSSRCSLKDGDVIKWVYTCDLGKDVGGSNAAR